MSNERDEHFTISLKKALEIIRRTSNYMLKSMRNGESVRKQAFILYSLPGIGKTEGLKSMAKSEDHLKVIDINAEFGGSLSMPIQSITPDNQALVLHALHEDIAELNKHAKDNPDDVHYLFLDEFNRGDEFMKQTLMQLLLNTKVPGHKLEDNIFVVGAGNTSENVFTTDIVDNEVNPLDVAARDRISPLFVNLSVNEWLDWGYKNAIDPRILNFIDSHNNKDLVLYKAPSTADGTGATPRSWSKLSDLLNIFSIKKDGITTVKSIVASQIGNELTNEFISYLTIDPPYRLDEILEDQSKALERFEDLNNTEMRQALCQMPSFIEGKLKAGKDVEFKSFISIIAGTSDQQALERFVRIFAEDDVMRKSFPTFNQEARQSDVYKDLIAQSSMHG